MYARLLFPLLFRINCAFLIVQTPQTPQTACFSFPSNFYSLYVFVTCCAFSTFVKSENNTLHSALNYVRLLEFGRLSTSQPFALRALMTISWFTSVLVAILRFLMLLIY